MIFFFFQLVLYPICFSTSAWAQDFEAEIRLSSGGHLGRTRGLSSRGEAFDPGGRRRHRGGHRLRRGGRPGGAPGGGAGTWGGHHGLRGEGWDGETVRPGKGWTGYVFSWLAKEEFGMMGTWTIMWFVSFFPKQLVKNQEPLGIKRGNGHEPLLNGPIISKSVLQSL